MWVAAPFALRSMTDRARVKENIPTPQQAGPEINIGTCSTRVAIDTGLGVKQGLEELHAVPVAVTQSWISFYHFSTAGLISISLVKHVRG
jgi:hypothetical protein